MGPTSGLIAESLSPSKRNFPNTCNKKGEVLIQNSFTGHARARDLRLATFGGLGMAWFRHLEAQGTRLVIWRPKLSTLILSLRP